MTHQQGFRPFHYTTTALSALEFLDHRWLLILLTYCSRYVFDKVCHRTQVELIHDTPLPRGIVRWLSNYLCSRQTTTIYNSQESSHRIFHCEFPQVSVLSPTLSTFYVHETPASPEYADISTQTTIISTPSSKAPKSRQHRSH